MGIEVRQIEWDSLTATQRQRIERRIALRIDDARRFHLYLKRLRKSRLRSGDPYVIVPKSTLRPGNFSWKVWKRLDKKVMVRRRALCHVVLWELHGPSVGAGGQRRKVDIPMLEGCSDRQVMEDFAAALSTGHKMRSYS